jgi:hypothetical protein
MHRTIKFSRVIAIIFLLFAISSCTKENVVSNDNNTVKQQKWNPNKDYPFVLPEVMHPYQYAIYKEDLPTLFEYIQNVFENHQEGEKEGYFILLLDPDMARVNYGFVNGVLNYKDDPVINPDDEDEKGGGMCFQVVASQAFDNFKDAQAWATKYVEKGYIATMRYDKKKNEYFVIVEE